jgi:hypothetical protein
MMRLGCGSVVEHLSGMCEAPDSIPSNENKIKNGKHASQFKRYNVSMTGVPTTLIRNKLFGSVNLSLKS